MRYDYDPTDPDAPQPGDVDPSDDFDDGYDDDDADEAISCAGCGRRLHVLAAVCPHCGEWVLDDSPAARRSRGWFWPIMVALLIAVILVLWSGLRL
ncbi:MAG TPA: protein NinF [Phycisphaerae bacterium]|nr:protein NinF [Phycisphaerae bacterium]HOJ73207.1 protein NinF [Phycisphaerae bacterium]HOM51227.1 protein NinF [Phycisphaerae bacterium]HON67471.1 protein NinF [Phycisphaerae bacterium]HOQ87710.1 protein NinF [Phycisphaerae bacterium]